MEDKNGERSRLVKKRRKREEEVTNVLEYRGEEYSREESLSSKC